MGIGGCTNKTALLALILALTGCGPQRSVDSIRGPGPDAGGLHTGPNGGTTGGNPTLLPVDPKGGDSSLSNVSLCFASAATGTNLNDLRTDEVRVVPSGLDLSTGVMKLWIQARGDYSPERPVQLESPIFTLSTGCDPLNKVSASATNAFGTFGTTASIQFKVMGTVSGTRENPTVAEITVDFSRALQRLKAVQPVASTSGTSDNGTTVDGSRPDQPSEPNAPTGGVSTSQQVVDAIQGSYPLIP